MKKLFFISLFFIGNTAYLFSQSAEENMEKYWYYRFKMQNDHMLIGDCIGCSLPVEARDMTDTDHGLEHELKWGESIKQLSEYLTVLATEYKLLSDNGQDVTQTTKELYYA